MQSLPAPAWGLTRRVLRGRRAGPLAVVLAALVVLIGLAVLLSLGSSDDASSHAASSAPARAASAGAPATALINGHALQRADCADWSAGTPAERAAVVASLRANVGGATGYGPAVTLADDQAFALFGRACSGTIGRGWLLYALYTRAAGFESQRR